VAKHKHLALQAGFDVKLNRNWSINVDVKKVQIRSDVYMAGEQISRVKPDPVLIGVGLGYRVPTQPACCRPVCSSQRNDASRHARQAGPRSH
jgi:hypothetical protein